MDQRRAAAALLALAAYIACSAAAPTASNHTALELHEGPIEGCYYNFQHYGEGDRIMTNEPCLNCTCHNRMLMCYLRVCPFTKAIGQDCTVEKRADQCCPIVTCPDVPVDLLTSTSTSSPAEYGSTGIGKIDKYGCSIHGKYFSEGSKVPPTPNKPCEHCYCIRNMTTCVMQECTLHVDGCTPIYHKDVCCPVRYSCDHSEDEIPLLDDMTTTVRPTPGFLLTTTTMVPVTQMSQDCVHDDQVFPDGALIKTEKACEHCYCMKGDIVCVVQECGTPMENEGKNCTSLPPRHGQCCPDTYICEGDELISESTTRVADITTAPPRRIGVEGSGYRNEPDEPYTEMGPLITDVEGSGEEYPTIPSIDTAEILIPEKGSPETIDDMLLTTTEKGLHLSTEPDKGQNTIPDSTSDKKNSEGFIQSNVDQAEDIDVNNISTGSDTMITVSHIQPTGDITSRKDEIVTTESAFRKEDSEEHISDNISTEKQYEKATTVFSDLVDKTIYEDEYIPHINGTIKEIVKDEKTTSSPIEYTPGIDEVSYQKEITTEFVEQTSPTEKNKFTDDLITTSDGENYIGLTTIRDEKLDTVETTSVNPNINEVETLPPTSSPSRIPGEGDCLLNGITYTNNTIVPSTNNCHINCKCLSSIIKCDPIICSPPPDYMESMNDCQPIYDSQDSCCPTYVCSAKETIPPQSHSQMSGTDTPKIKEDKECEGKECTKNKEMVPSTEQTTDCLSGNCLHETPEVQVQCDSESCKDQGLISPEKPQDCSSKECEVPPVVSCDGENCEVEPTKDLFPEKVSEPGLQDTSSTLCDEKDGCDEQKIMGVDKCSGENCRRTENADIGEKQPADCSGSDCEAQNEPSLPSFIEQSTEIVSVDKAITSSEDQLGLQTTESTEIYKTTSREKEAVSSVEETTKQLEFSEPIPTVSIEIGTELPTQVDAEKESSQTILPIGDIVTDKSDADIGKTETSKYETPKVSEATITEKYEPVYTEPPKQEVENDINIENEYGHTTDKDFTEVTKYHIEPEVFTDQTPTKKPHDIDAHVTEFEYTVKVTESPEAAITDKQLTETEGQDGRFTEKEVIVTKAPELIGSEITEKGTEIPVLGEEATESDIIQPIAPETVESDKIDIQTEVTIPQEMEMEKFQTEATEAAIFDEEKRQTEVPDNIISENDVMKTETPQVAVTDEEIFKTGPPEPSVTEKETTNVPEIISDGGKVQTERPEKSADTTKEIVETVAPETIVTEKVAIQTSIPEQDEIKLETTTLVAEPITVTNIIQETEKVKEDDMTPSVTQEPVTKESVTEVLTLQTDKSNVFDISHEPEPIKSEETGTEKVNGIISDSSISLEPFETETEKVAIDKIDVTETHEPDTTEAQTISVVTIGVPEINKITTLSEDGSKVTLSVLPEIVTEKQDKTYYTTTVQELITKSEDLVHETLKEDTTKLPLFDIDKQSITTDKTLFEKEPTTESYIMLTKAPEAIPTQYDDISTGQSDSKQTEISMQDTESSSTPGININQIIYTESPESYLTSLQELDNKDVKIKEEETTILPEAITSISGEISDKEKSTEKQYLSTTVELEKPVDIIKDTNEPLDILTMTTESIKATTISDINIKETEEKEISVTEMTQQETSDDLNTTEEVTKDEKKDFETEHITQDSSKIPETSTYSQVIVIEDSSKLPSYTDEQPQEITTASGQLETESKKPYKDFTTQELLTTISDIPLEPTQSPNKDTIAQEQTITQEDSTINVIETESNLQTTTSILDKDQSESELYPPVTPKQVTEAETINEITTSKQIPTQSEIEVEVTFSPEAATATPEKDKDIVEIVHEQEKETPYVTESSSTKHSDFSQDKVEIGTTEEYLIAVSELSTDTEPHEIEKVTLPYPETQETEKITFEISTKMPESITKIEEQVTEYSTFGIKEKEVVPDTTTQTFLDLGEHTNVLDDKIVDKEQEPEHDMIFTTISTLQIEDEKKMTEIPMSLVTDIEQEKSTEKTVTEKEQTLSQTVPTTPIVQDKSEEKTQTTKSQQQESEQPIHVHVQVETSTDSNAEGLPTLPPHKDRTTLASTDDDLSKDHHEQTTDTSVQLSDAVTDITTTSAVEADLSIQVTHVTPIIHLSYTDKEDTSTILPISETGETAELPEQHKTSISIPVDKSTTEILHEGYTIPEKSTTIPPKTVEDKEEDKIVSSGATTEEQESATEYSELHIPEINTILPEKITTEIKTEVFDGTTESPEQFVSIITDHDTAIHSSDAPGTTEKSTLAVTEIKDTVITETEQKPTELAKTPDTETTTSSHVEIVTEEQTESVPLIQATEAHDKLVTLKEESDTKLLDQYTTEADQTEVAHKPTEPSTVEHFTITDDTGLQDVDEHIPVHDISHTPDEITTVPESQTENIGLDKVSPSLETSGELETSVPVVTEEEIDHTGTQFTEPIVEKEAHSTPSTQSVVKVDDITGTAKIEEHTVTEPTPTVFVDATAGSVSIKTHEEEMKQTSESEYKFSETTPFLVELEEHTHKVVDESSKIPIEDKPTTVSYETQQTERGDQSLDVLDKDDNEYNSFEPTRTTEQFYDDKSSTSKQEQIEKDIHATTDVIKDVTESSTVIETEKPTPTKIETSPVSDFEELEKTQTVTIKDTTLLPSISPEVTNEKELFTTSPEVQKTTQSEVEIAVTTEKTNFIGTEDNLKPEILLGTTLSEEVFEQQTSKATTIETKQETYLPSTIDKSKPEEKPIVTTISPAHELPKPGFNDEIIDDLPSPDFPPSGTGGYGQEPDYVEEDQAFGPGTCRYGGKVYVSAQQIPRDDPCDFCFCFRSDIICLQQSCPPPIHGCHEEPIQGFCCPRYECPVSMATTLNVTTTTTTTTTTLPPHFLPHAYKGAAQRRGCQIKGHTYKVGEVVRASSGPCLHCTCGGDGQMKCDPKACTPEPMLRQMIAAAVSAKRRR